MNARVKGGVKRVETFAFSSSGTESLLERQAETVVRGRGHCALSWPNLALTATTVLCPTLLSQSK